MFSHKGALPSGRILASMISHGKAFFYPSVSTFMIASCWIFKKRSREESVLKILISPEFDSPPLDNSSILGIKLRRNHAYETAKSIGIYLFRSNFLLFFFPHRNIPFLNRNASEIHVTESFETRETGTV